MSKLSKYLLAMIFTMAPTVSSAGVVSFVVDAKIHSSNMMNGMQTGVMLDKDEAFSVWADDEDMWFLGGGTVEYSNADGLSNYPRYPQMNLNTYYGTLVGAVGSGGFFEIGTRFDGIAPNAGELLLFNWDSGNSENVDTITAFVRTADKPVAPVPVPASGGLMLLGLLGIGYNKRAKNYPLQAKKPAVVAGFFQF